MNKITIILIAITVLILGGGAYLATKDNSKPIPTPEPGVYQYFWGNGCPHCANVAAFEETWSGKDKIKINKLEVWNSAENARVMADRAKVCGIKETELAVPLLITLDGKCLMGDTPIIDFFKSLNL
jgi:hypothetical protein